MRAWTIAILLFTAVLAGCSDTPDPVTQTPQVEDPEVEEENVTEPPVEPVNTAPAAQLTADLLNGTAPLLVNITLNGTDADGDSLTWTLQQNGTEAANGTQLPATLAFNLTTGNHSFLLTISDGESDASANLTVVVAAGVPAGPCGGAPAPCIIVEHPWVTVWSDGRCDAKGAVGDEAAGWLHDRPGSAVPVVGGNPAGGDWPQGTGYLSGGGTWVYEESNGIDGLQLNDNVSAAASELGTDGFAVDLGCTGGDTMVF